MEKDNTLISGVWKFNDNTDPRDIESFARELAEDPHYLHVYIRKASKDQEGLGFLYKSDEPVEKDVFAKFNDDVKDKLYKKFGTKLVGWDISSSTAFIKGL